MKVHLYTKLWNEEEMLPFFFRHYDPLIDRYIIYDDGSTDNTLKLLAAHDRVEVRRFVRAHPTSFVRSAQALNDSMWKESRGQADWVIITSVDEHLHHPTGLKWYLRVARYRGITAIPALAFQMVADAFPSPDEYLVKTRRFGAPLDHYNKLKCLRSQCGERDLLRGRASQCGIGGPYSLSEARSAAAVPLQISRDGLPTAPLCATEQRTRRNRQRTPVGLPIRSWA